MRKLLSYTLLMGLVYQAQAYQLPDQKLYHYQCKNCMEMSHDTLSTSWLIEDKTMDAAKAKSVKSKRYYRKINGKALKQGIELGILAEDAVIRLNPIKPRQMNTHWQKKLLIQTKQQTKPLADVAQSLNDEQEFQAQFVVGPAVIFQLKPGMLASQPKLVYNDAKLADDSQWQISVYDKRSDLYLSVELDKGHYRIGETIKSKINVDNDFNLPEVNWVEARIMGPDEQGMYVDLVKDGMYQFHGNTKLDSKLMAQGENWYFMVMADLTVNGSHTLRTAQMPFSYVVPSAKIRSVYLASKDQPLALRASVEAVQASRYQLQAVLYATGDDGQIHSVALAQTSAWVDGIAEIDLIIDKPLPSNMHTPYYLGKLELVDDAQLKPVYRYNERIPFSKLDV